MKRKIEKFLAHKVGVDEAQILADEDGRYDLKGDFDGALAAVRGKEIPSANRGRSSNPPKSAQAANRRSYPEPRQIGHYYHAHYAPPPPPPPTYTVAANAGFPHHATVYHPSHHAPAGPMMPIHGKENSMNRNYPPPQQHAYWTTDNSGLGVRPPTLPPPPQPNLSPHPTIKSGLDDDDDFASACLLSAKKSIFDTPPKLRMNDTDDPSSISKIDIRGMTPDTDFRNTFRSPMADSREGASLLTKDEAFSLNKSLFSEAVMSTPCNQHINKNGLRNKDPVRFGIGQEQDTDLNNRVSVSPIQASAAASSSHIMSSQPKSEKKSVNFKVELTPNVPTITTGLTPFDSVKMAKHLTTTPSTAATADQSSFWSEMSPGIGPLSSPFASPDLPLSSTPKKRRTSDGSFGQ
jgi:hypothetical protein